MKSILLIGLSRFGKHLLIKLNEMNKKREVKKEEEWKAQRYNIPFCVLYAE